MFAVQDSHYRIELTVNYILHFSKYVLHRIYMIFRVIRTCIDLQLFGLYRGDNILRKLANSLHIAQFHQLYSFLLTHGYFG